MSKKRSNCISLKRSTYFFSLLLVTIFLFGELSSQFEERALVRDRQSATMLEFTRANYDFSIEGGKQSLPSGQWAKIIVGVKKGNFPIAGKKVFISFAQPVLLLQDAKEVSVMSAERFTDEFGRVTFQFLPKQVGDLEVLVFLLHPVENYNQHLFRLNYFIYKKEQLQWSFLSPFIALVVLGFFVLSNLFFALLFPALTKSFFTFAYDKKSLKDQFFYLYGFIYRFIERQPTQMLFPLLLCRPYHLLKKERHLRGERKKLHEQVDEVQVEDWQIQRQLLLKNEIKKIFVFLFCAILWVALYVAMPYFALLLALLLFAFVKKPWAFSFLFFCFFNLLFAAFLSQPQPPIEEIGQMFGGLSFFIVVIFLLFPSPALAMSFFMLAVNRFIPSWQDYFFSFSGNSLSTFLSGIDFGLLPSFWVAVFVSLFSTAIIYFYCRNEIKRRGSALKKASGDEVGDEASSGEAHYEKGSKRKKR